MSTPKLRSDKEFRQERAMGFEPTTSSLGMRHCLLQTLIQTTSYGKFIRRFAPRFAQTPTWPAPSTPGLRCPNRSAAPSWLWSKAVGETAFDWRNEGWLYREIIGSGGGAAVGAVKKHSVGRADRWCLAAAG